MNNIYLWRRVVVLFGALLIFQGCSYIGPVAIRKSRTDYNVALQHTADEQMLLNLVRLRYRDHPFFLEATTLTTQFAFTPKIGANLSAGEDTATSGSISGDIGYEERPTITYTPLQGEEFVTRVMSPISWSTIELLDNIGWRTDRVFRICVQSFGNMGNAKTASGPTPSVAPPYKHFLKAIEIYNHLKERNLVRTYTGKLKDREAEIMEFSSEALHEESYWKLMRLLKLNGKRKRYEILLNRSRTLPNTIHIGTRSFSGILYFLSQSVIPPQRDIDAGRVTITYDKHGNIFDWRDVTKDLMVIQSSDHEPKNAAVKVFYRGSWFYIDDSDLNSKSTFVLLGQLYMIQAGKVQRTEPILTIPVGR